MAYEYCTLEGISPMIARRYTPSGLVSFAESAGNDRKSSAGYHTEDTYLRNQKEVVEKIWALGWQRAGSHESLLFKRPLPSGTSETHAFALLTREKTDLEQKVGIFRKEKLWRSLVLEATPEGWKTIDTSEPALLEHALSTAMEDQMFQRLSRAGWTLIPGEKTLYVKSLLDISTKTSARTPQPTLSEDPFEQLRKLGELRTAGILSEGEFQIKKAEILKRV
jgi:hypothetical protein